MGGSNQEEYLLGKKVDKSVGVDGTDDIAAGAGAVGVSERLQPRPYERCQYMARPECACVLSYLYVGVPFSELE